MMPVLPGVADEASERDRVWFERHPGRSVYVRGFVPGELPMSLPHGDGIQCTVVRQLRPGARMRLPICLRQMPPDTDAAAFRVLRLALGKDA